MIGALGRRLYHAVAAYRDYRDARGYRHKKALGDLQDKLDEKIGDVERERTDVRDSIQKNRTYIKEDARSQAFKELLREELTSVRGIGDTLADRIRRHSRINDLSSLRRYAKRVKGIGGDKAVRLQSWARRSSDQLEDRATELASESVEYEERRKQIEEAEDYVERLENHKQYVKDLKSRLVDVRNTLNAVSFRRLYRARVNGDSDGETDHTVIERFFRGVYGPWESPPEWLEEIQGVVKNA